LILLARLIRAFNNDHVGRPVQIDHRHLLAHRSGRVLKIGSDPILDHAEQGVDLRA
jgi:hypothetical protein